MTLALKRLPHRLESGKNGPGLSQLFYLALHSLKVDQIILLPGCLLLFK